MYTISRQDAVNRLARETQCSLYEAAMAHDRCHGDFFAAKALLARLAPTPTRRAAIVPPSSEVLSMMYPQSHSVPSDLSLRRVIVQRRTSKSSQLCRNTLVMHRYDVGKAVEFLGTK